GPARRAGPGAGARGPPRAPPPPRRGPLDGLAAGADRRARRAPRVGVAPPRGLPPAGAALRDAETEPLHQRRQFDELFPCQLGEALRPQQLLPACERDLFLADRPRRRRPPPLHDAVEDAVVDGNLLRTRDERQAAGPVEILRPELGGGAAELDDAAGPHRKPLGAQRPREYDEPPDLVSH